MILGKIAQKKLFGLLENIHTGTLHLYTPDGITRRFGNGHPIVHWDVKDWRTFSAMFARGDVGLGESYAQGWWETPDLEALTTLALKNHDVIKTTFGGPLAQRLIYLATDKLLRANSKTGSRKNIAAHYDISNAFYERWLDPSMTYSAALFENGGESLLDAQNRKYDRLLKAAGASGPRTLEIGCGWGGFAERAAETGDRDITAITISEAQHTYAKDRLCGRAEIRLQDYRDLTGQYDSIVSIEMIEAVGERYWPTYFSTIKNNLAPGGRAALQAIIVEDDWFDLYRSRTDFIRQYTFPGGMLISPKMIKQQANAAGLEVENIFRFGRDYARTLRYWRQDFEAALPHFEEEGYAPQFLRGWKYYLDTCAAAFEVGTRTNVIHVELCHD